jgi:NAD(P)-dependent dehydrogenase (short-subunit alcohol dehydrogenase family)
MNPLDKFFNYCERVCQKRYGECLTPYSHETFDFDPHLVDEKAATERLYSHFDRFRDFLDEIPPEVGERLFVSGSTTLASVLADPSFRPDDVDLYTSDSSPRIPVTIDRCVRKIYGSKNLILVKTPYTITWWIHNLESMERTSQGDASCGTSPPSSQATRPSNSYNSDSDHCAPKRRVRLPKTASPPISEKGSKTSSPETSGSTASTNKKPNHPIIQLVLPAVGDFSEVFAGYHSNLVCLGFDLGKRRFYYATDWWSTYVETKKVFFIPHVTTTGEYDRFLMAFDKYVGRGFDCQKLELVDNDCQFDSRERTDDRDSQTRVFLADSPNNSEYAPPLHRETCIGRKYITLKKIDVSPKHDLRLIEESLNKTFYLTQITVEDVAKYLESKQLADSKTTFGRRLCDVYQGELLKPLLLAVTPFRVCSGCETVCKEYERPFSDSGYCHSCYEEATKKCQFNADALYQSKARVRVLVTGGRCGLGREIVKQLSRSRATVSYTTRFREEAATDRRIVMDLKDPSSWTEINECLDRHDFDVMILSAAETLHFDDRAIDTSKVDWTNDYVRPNTGIWFKTIDQTTDDEMVSPIMANIYGNANLIRHYIRGLKSHPDRGSPCKMIICVTSTEGSFMDKSPYHPMTNATKSALEQLVNTVKRQIEVLDARIVLVDPGWMYTESAFGKQPGPTPIFYGAQNVLHPLARHISGEHVANGSHYS